MSSFEGENLIARVPAVARTRMDVDEIDYCDVFFVRNWRNVGLLQITLNPNQFLFQNARFSLYIRDSMRTH